MVHAVNARSECLGDRDWWVDDTHGAWGQREERLQRGDVNILDQ